MARTKAIGAPNSSGTPTESRSPFVEAADRLEIVVGRVDREQDGDRAAFQDSTDRFERAPGVLRGHAHEGDGAGRRVCGGE